MNAEPAIFVLTNSQMFDAGLMLGFGAACGVGFFFGISMLIGGAYKRAVSWFRSRP